MSSHESQPSSSPSSSPNEAALPAGWKEPARLAAAWRSLKTWVHIALRTGKNLAGGPGRFARGYALTDAPLVAEFRSPLWLDGRADEFILRCGKVQNLRAAIRYFDGIEVGAGQTLSFWAQVGRPSSWRGFVDGREIVSGCVVPTVGGGLCQLSNSLAALAVAADMRIIERHRHSALVEEQGAPEEDATVAWNYVDLRIAADFSFRIEAELTQDELVLRLRARRQSSSTPSSRISLPPARDERPVARGCLTCDQTSCFRHRINPPVEGGRVAVLLNDRHPELAKWLEHRHHLADWMVPWVRPRLRNRTWVVPPEANRETALWPSWRRIVMQRLFRGEGAARQAGRVQTATALAKDYARRLRPEHTDLVVTQDLLVPLWRLGALGGRSYEVYVHELPASELQSRLDAAAIAHPHAESLRDFRVDPTWSRDEWNALARARTLLTAHREIYRVLVNAGLKPELLPWEIQPAKPAVVLPRTSPPTLTLASSALARKGAIEVASVAKALGARVLILGSPPGDETVWEGVNWSAVGYDSDWIAQSDVVLLPAYIEHNPRALLQAIAAGLPVVASAACGLDCHAGHTEVLPGDPLALEAAVRASLASGSEPGPNHSLQAQRA